MTDDVDEHRVLSVLASLDGHGLAGAAVAVHLNGTLHEAAAGRATSETMFGVWSVAKVYTAAVFAALAAAGTVDLDAPASRYLPELAVPVRDRITVAQLLGHTAGLDGDAIADLGDGDDCRQRYVRGLTRVAQLFPPGSAHGYSNAGYIVLGALAERVTGATWEDLVRTTILEPAGLCNTTPYGHEGAAQYATWRSCAPCGSRTWATAADLARFGALHLPPGDLAVLRRPMATIPGYEDEERTSCLGWKSVRWSGTRMLTHDGGAHAFLRVLPDAGMAIAVLVDGPGGPPFAESLVAALTGLRPPRGPFPAGPPPGLDLEPYLGTYRAARLNATVTRGGDTLTLTLGSRVAQPAPLTYRSPTTFELRGARIAFTAFDDAGRPRLLHVGGSRTAVRATD